MSIKEEKSILKIYTSQPWELMKTAFMVLSWIVLGMHLEIASPTLTILAENTNSTIQDISLIFVLRSGGYILGSLFGTVGENIVKQHSEGLLSCSYFMAAIVLFLTPIVRNLIIVALLSGIQGIAQGLADLGGTSLMLAMWGDHVSTPLNIVHCGFGVGVVILTFLVKPFLGKDGSVTIDTNTETTITKSSIITPYVITGLICIVIAIGHLILSIHRHRVQREALKNRPVDYVSVSTSALNEMKDAKTTKHPLYSPLSYGNGYFTYGLLMTITWTTYMFFLSGNDISFSKFFFTFVKTAKSQSTGVTTDDDAIVALCLYWVSYSIGRFFCAIATVFIEVHLALIFLWISGLILAVMWAVSVWAIGLTYMGTLILGAFTGLVFSPTYPLSFAFINQRLKVNSFVVGVLLCGSGFGAMVFPRLAGVILHHSPQNFPIILIFCGVLTAILFTVAMIISTIHRKKTKSQTNSVSIDKETETSKPSEEEQQMQSYLMNSEQEKN